MLVLIASVGSCANARAVFAGSWNPAQVTAQVSLDCPWLCNGRWKQEQGEGQAAQRCPKFNFGYWFLLKIFFGMVCSQPICFFQAYLFLLQLLDDSWITWRIHHRSCTQICVGLSLMKQIGMLHVHHSSFYYILYHECVQCYYCIQLSLYNLDVHSLDIHMFFYRILELGFGKEIEEILDRLGSMQHGSATEDSVVSTKYEFQRQNLLLSATLNEKVNHLAKMSLEKPVMIGMPEKKTQSIALHEHLGSDTDDEPQPSVKTTGSFSEDYKLPAQLTQRYVKGVRQYFSFLFFFYCFLCFLGSAGGVGFIWFITLHNRCGD